MILFLCVGIATWLIATALDIAAHRAYLRDRRRIVRNHLFDHYLKSDLRPSKWG